MRRSPRAAWRLGLVPGFVFVGMLAHAGPAWAWGKQGHAVVCEIAYAEMNPKTRDEVDRLLRSGRRGMRKAEGKGARYGQFGRACAWPDEKPRRRGRSHCINTARTTSAVDPGDCGPNQTCLFTAIDHDKAVLRDPEASDQEKLAALMYLGHWIGDLHQPLHVSFADDRGGNLLEVEGGVCKGSLHWAWDACLVKERLGRGIRRVARRLVRTLQTAERAQWRESLDPALWANESFAIATSAQVGYCIRVDDACRYAPDRIEHGEGESQRTVVVDATYLEANGPTAQRRIEQAGVRLAAFLDDALR